MGTLTGSLSIANQAIEAQQTGLQVTANNLANVNTPGYSRQVVNLAEQASFSPQSGVGGGITVQQIQSIRDAVLEIRIGQEMQTQGSLTSLQDQLNPVQMLFNTSSGAGLGTAIDNFFSSLQQLSTNPTDGAQRQAVITAAQTMTQTFQQVSQALTQQQAGANQEIVQNVGQANTLLGQIATLNNQIADMQNSGQNTGPLVDQRTNLIDSLAGTIDFNTSDAGNGEVNLTTTGGQALVVGNSSYALTLATNSAGMQDIYAGGADITSTITGGSLAGLIQARDQVLPQLGTQIDQLAGSIASSLNTQNQAGFTAAGAAGGNLFTPPPAGNLNAAAAMALATTDPNAIAASGSATASGDNSNLMAMAGLQNQAFVGGQTPDNAYATVVSTIGTVLSGANTQQQASQMVLTQLQNQRDALSGVSTDQESINLSQFQTGYNAAARVVTAIQNMTKLAINLGQD
jgi:flagellar hook-associated protein 1 FlgK